MSMFGVCNIAQAQPDLRRGLVAYWGLNSVSTDVTGSHNATFTNTTYVAGKVGNAIHSGGQTTSGTFTAVALPASWTISMWVYHDTGGSLQAYIAGGPFGIYRDTTGKLQVWSGAPTLSATTIALTTWTHIVIVSNGSTLSFYFNGSLDANHPAYGGARNPDKMLYDSNAGNNMLGSMDEVGMWNRALSTTEIASLYNSGNGLPYSFVNTA